MKQLMLAALLGVSTMAFPAMSANLLVNGDFEASTNPTTTPPGWTNIGHSDGVISYGIGPLPAYDGNYFYDLGGYGDATGPVGDGIMQSVATTIGKTYKLTFGLSSEDVAGETELEVLIGGQSTLYSLTSGGTWFLKGFKTQSISYVATSALTTISFIETMNSSGGNNDPLIDGVRFDGAVPEPASWAMMVGGFGLLGASMRSQRRARYSLV
ncbi:MAG TPA: PEPxxWA-CTERM sorting domain-containing protein [Sphingomonas sp.]|nr:PEPxxWA-CTERM sorting domain-containing protein [Sphingomonas sp.]